MCAYTVRQPASERWWDITVIKETGARELWRLIGGAGQREEKRYFQSDRGNGAFKDLTDFILQT